MKLFVVFFFLAVANCEVNDGWRRFGNVKPNNQIREWQDEFPFRRAQKNSEFTGIEGRIIRGTEAERFQYPFQVAIIVTYSGGDSGFCGGSLISNEYVLSAANCFKKSQGATVLLNVTNIKQDEPIIVGVLSIKIHENFGSSSFENDLAILRLARKVSFGLGVQPIRLPKLSDSHTTFVERTTYALGWGKPKSGFKGDVPIPELKSLEGVVMKNSLCKAAFPVYVDDKNICTHVYIGTPCDGDEGGPLILQEEDGQYTQVGLFSYQLQLYCDMGWPAVFTRISKFLNWIESNTNVDLRY